MRLRLGTDKQDARVLAGCNQRVGDRKTVGKSGALVSDVEHSDMPHIEHRLHVTAGSRKEMLGAKRCEDYEFDIRHRPTGVLECPPGCLCSQRGTAFAIGRPTPLTDTATLNNPFFRNIELLCQFAVGYYSLRKIRAHPGDTAARHRTSGYSQITHMVLQPSEQCQAFHGKFRIRPKRKMDRPQQSRATQFRRTIVESPIV